MDNDKFTLELQLFSNAFEHAAIGMALVSPEGKFLKVNKSICQLVGYSQGELLNIDFQSITYPDDLESDLAFLKEALRGERETYQLEKRYFHKDGSVVWGHLSVSTIRDEDSTLKFFIFQIQDITERKEKEEELKLIIASSQDGYFDWHIPEDYEYMSPRFWEIFGYLPEEKKHHPSQWQELIFQEDLPRILENFNEHVKSKGELPFSQQVRYLHKDGSTVWVICKGKVVDWDKEGNPLRLIGTHTDITEFKKIQQKLEEEQTAQSHSARLAALGQMASNIAHEINNPLTILAGHAEVLLSCIDEKDEASGIMKNSATVIQKTVQRISAVIKGLRNFARDGKNGEFGEFSLGELTDEIFALSEQRCRQYEVNFSIADDVKKTTLFGHRVLIAQVLINLFNNSFDAVKGLDERWIRFSVDSDQKNNFIKVQDSGKNLPLDIKEKLMTPFFTTKKAGEGTGIGLSLCKNIIEKHFGRLSIDDSSPHTTFVISLPKRAFSLREA